MGGGFSAGQREAAPLNRRSAGGQVFRPAAGRCSFLSEKSRDLEMTGSRPPDLLTAGRERHDLPGITGQEGCFLTQPGALSAGRMKHSLKQIPASQLLSGRMPRGSGSCVPGVGVGAAGRGAGCSDTCILHRVWLPCSLAGVNVLCPSQPP